MKQPIILFIVTYLILFSRLDGLVTGVSGVVGCLVRPLQERWSPSVHQDSNANAFLFSNFEPRYQTAYVFDVVFILLSFIL